MDECIFDKIIAGKIPSKTVHQDDRVFAFRDINPQAPVHILIIPKRHIASLNDITEADEPLLGHMIKVAGDIARKEGVAQKGYRLAINTGREGGQLVQHLHMHLLGGRELTGKLG